MHSKYNIQFQYLRFQRTRNFFQRFRISSFQRFRLSAFLSPLSAFQHFRVSVFLSAFLFFSFSVFIFSGCETVRNKSSEEHRNIYHIRSGDLVSVEVYNEPDISRSFKVSSDGAINHPLLGRVTIVGMSVSGIETLIYELLAADYFVEPIVNVSMTSSSDRPVMIFGEVRSPGAYEVKAGQRLTILQVISEAGGFTDIASRDKVRIVRIADGKEQTIKVRVSDLFRGRDGITDINLRPGDIITVPETIF